MAQIVRCNEVDLKALLSQAKEMELLQNDGIRQKNSGAYVPAGKLTYTNPSGWKIDTSAELIGSCVLHVDGNYMTEKLEKLSYEVSFVVLLKDNFNISSPVSLTLTLPNGSSQVNGYGLMSYPRNTPFSLKAGEFFNKFDYGDIKFALDGTESVTMKTGLVIYGVNISPTNA